MSRWILFLVSTLLLQAQSFPGQPGSDPWLNRPNDPYYDEMWQLYSHLPVDHRGMVSEQEARMGSGLHVDRAWQLHTGEASTVIAILDSGIRWSDADLVDRHFLNRRELPLPEGSQVYDRNGDGRFSVNDYSDDSRVSDLNQNGKLDSGDLILAFSNQVDEDANGYVDDIAGWDFHENNNDPGDRTDFGHGTGEARDSVAALNNGVAGSGICGNCSFIMLRVDDSFVVDANAFAEAVVYATNIGATMIQQALGSYNNGPLVQRAIDYAYDHNVPIIGSAADETSYHHNYPSTLDPIIYTNSIRYDTPDYRDASTFLNFNNCSNYGSRVDVATSGRSCSSEATANLGGITGLTLSFLKQMGKKASTGEIISLIKNSADDINLGPNTAAPERYSTFAGWDTMTGYGRTNAYNMLSAVKEDRIPPEARIVSPQWYETYNQENFSGIEVQFASGPALNSNKVQLEIAHGVETHNTTWLLVPTINSNNRITVYPETFAAIPEAEGLLPRDRFAYTLRLKVTNAAGLTSEARRTIYVINDPDLKAGFPKKLQGSGEGTGFFADLNGDGAEEYISGDGGGWIHAYTHTGGELPNFPVPGVISRHSLHRFGWDRTYASIFAPVSGGDLDQDGIFDIVFASAEGAIGVVDHAGRPRLGFPVQIPAPDWSESTTNAELSHGVLSSPVIADLDGDGHSEIVVAALDGKIYAFSSDGSLANGFPVKLAVSGTAAKILASPSIADLNSDGIQDIVVGTNHVGAAAGTIFAIDGRGNAAPQLNLPGFPRKIPLARDVILPTIGTGVPTSMVIADIDGDQRLDILVHGFFGKAYSISSDGRLQGSYSISVPANAPTIEDTMFTGFGHPSLMRMTPGGPLFPVMVGVGRNMLVSLLIGGKKVNFEHLVGVWDPAQKTFVSGYPRVMDDMQLGSGFISADLDGDGRDEIIGGSGGHFVHAFNAAGEVGGFPHFTGGWTLGSPSLGDFDGDGQLDVAASTREGFLFIWRTPHSDHQTLTWSNYKGNIQRTGKLGG